MTDNSLCLLRRLALDAALAVERPDERLGLAAQRLPVIKDRPEDDPHICAANPENAQETNAVPRTVQLTERQRENVLRVPEIPVF